MAPHCGPKPDVPWEEDMKRIEERQCAIHAEELSAATWSESAAVQDLMHTGAAQPDSLSDGADGRAASMRSADRLVSSLGRRDRLSGGAANCGERGHLLRVTLREKFLTSLRNRLAFRPDVTSTRRTLGQVDCGLQDVVWVLHVVLLDLLVRSHGVSFACGGLHV